MTEGESFIEEFLQLKKIKYRVQQPIDGLEHDSKSHRIADFYLPQYRIYLEYFGQWGNDSHKERYREKRQVYLNNKIPCVLLYPENLGILDYVFEKRVIYILKRYKLETELKKYRNKIFWEDKREHIVYLIIGIGLIIITYPWQSDRGFFGFGIVIVLYQLFRLYRDYKAIFTD